MARKFKTPITIDELGSASSQALAANVDGDSQNRINIDAGGKITWGSGSATGDTTLYRSAADTLKTDDAFTATSLAVTGQFTFPTSDGSADQVITTNGSGTLTWSDVVANATVSDTAPSSPSTGQIWYESDTGKTFVYYDSYWIEVGASPPASPFITDLDEDTKIQVEESADEDKIRFDTAGSERMIIDASGNVGIGTSSPETPLNIVTTNKLGATFTGTTDGEGVRVDQSNYTSGNYVSLIESSHQDDQTAPHVRIGAMFDGGGSHLAFGTSNSYASGITNTAMFIDETGNVGIGTTSPSTSAPYEDYILTLGGGGWYTFDTMSMVNGPSSTGVNSNDPGILLNSVAMNTSSWATPGLYFTSTDGQFTTESPKYLAAIVGQATSTYNDDGDAGMNINFRLTGNNQGTSNLLYATSYGYNMTATSFYHFTDNTASLGLSSLRWSVVYAASGSINTSDIRDKTDVADLDYGLDFVNNLRPVKYRYADRDAEIEGVRTHMGFIAQEVRSVLGDDASSRGLWTSSEFEKTEFIDDDDNPVYSNADRQGLRYEEIIAPIVKAIQELTARIETLEAG